MTSFCPLPAFVRRKLEELEALVLQLRHLVIERRALEVHNDAGVRNGIVGQMYRERLFSFWALETRVVGRADS